MRPAALAGVLAVAAALLASGCSSPATGASTAPTHASVSLSRSHPIRDETFSAAGRVSTRFARPVVLRWRQSGSWRTLRRAETSAAGRYRFPGLRASAARTYSVRVPAASHAGRRFAAATSASRTVHPVRQTATVDVLPGIAQRGATTAPSRAARDVVAARFVPARPGRPVRIRRQASDGSWRTVALTSQRSDGTAYWFGDATGGAAFDATTSARSGAAAVTSAPQAFGWTTSFSDEFRGTALDTARWGTRNEGAYIGSRQRSAPSRKAARLTGHGALKLMVLKDPHRNACKTRTQRKSCFLNGQISTVDGTDPYTFRYGVASARVKYPRQRGQHGSFWMQPTSAAGGSEIDVSEFFGRGYPKGGLATFLYSQRTHVKLGGVWSRAAALKPRNDQWWTGYHVFTVKWTPHSYVFYVDGRRLWSSTKAASRVPEYLILSLLTSDWEVDRLSSTPTSMYVDWVKVWQ